MSLSCVVCVGVEHRDIVDGHGEGSRDVPC
jgi:hypothetical protein